MSKSKSSKSHQEKTPYIKMAFNEQHIQFTPDAQRTGIKTILTVDRLTGKFMEDKIKFDETTAKLVNIYGILGILKVFGKPILFYIDEAELVATFHSLAIFKVQSVKALQLISEVESVNHMENDKTHQVCKYLKQSMFFSFAYDLTLDCSTNKSTDEKLRMNKSHRFWWNFHMLESMFKENISQEWCLRAIQGYASSFQIELTTGQTVEYVLLSRREWMRGGTRYNHRGIDEDGNTANFVETEQIIRIDDIVSSHLQIRGSVPIYWHQVGLRATSQLTKDFSQSQIGFRKHIELLTQDYKNILCVNLMSAHSSNESIITKNFEDLLKKDERENVRYQFIDFHHVCKDSNYEPLNSTIMKNQDMIQSFSFSSYDPKGSRQEQYGVLRTNCLDCLDRTNVFMSKIALVVVNDILVNMGVNVFKEFNSQSLLYMADRVKVQSHKIISSLKQIWADNGDAISKVYVGTNATTTKIQNQGGGKWTGMLEKGMKGIERLYRQNFEDNQKQDIYELIVGLKSKNEDNQKEVMEQIHTKILQDKEKKESTALFVINWNLHQLSPHTSELNMLELFDIEEERVPDIIVVLITNYVNTRLVVDNLKALFSELVMTHFGKYELVVTSDLFQQITFIFVKSINMSLITKTENSKVQFSSDSGAFVTKIHGKYTLGVINTIFDQDITAKGHQINQIHNQAFRLQNEFMLDQCDYIIYAGDLNFIIQLNNDKAEELKENKSHDQSKQIINYLHSYDQIHAFKKTLMMYYQEPSIEDAPLMDGSLQWRNRILFGSVKGFISSNKIYRRVGNFCPNNSNLNPQVLYTNVYKKHQDLKSPDLNDKHVVEKFLDEIQHDDQENMCSSQYFSPNFNVME